MLFQYNFKNNIKEMSLVFHNGVKPIQMKRTTKASYTWSADITLDEGVYLYKYAINSSIRFNDPLAQHYVCDESGEVWSVAIVDKSDITPIKSDTLMLQSADLNILINEGAKLYAKAYYSNGIHSISIMWHQGNGQLIKFEEHMISAEYIPNSPLEYEFILDTSNINLVVGLYKVSLFIDGEQVYTNYFQMMKYKRIPENIIDIAI